MPATAEMSAPSWARFCFASTALLVTCLVMMVMMVMMVLLMPPVPGPAAQAEALSSILLWHSLMPRAAIAVLAGAA
ncbi:MAG: Fe(3+)-hydroxamate ABC transporter permease FhuB, partial [Pseudorhizobium sp.]